MFLANMSHELRTPLNAVIGLARIIKDELLGAMNEPRYRDYAADIHSSGKHLLPRVINDILDMTKVGAGRISCARMCAMSAPRSCGMQPL